MLKISLVAMFVLSLATLSLAAAALPAPVSINAAPVVATSSIASLPTS